MTRRTKKNTFYPRKGFKRAGGMLRGHKFKTIYDKKAQGPMTFAFRK